MRTHPPTRQDGARSQRGLRRGWEDRWSTRGSRTGPPGCAAAYMGRAQRASRGALC